MRYFNKRITDLSCDYDDCFYYNISYEKNCKHGLENNTCGYKKKSDYKKSKMFKFKKWIWFHVLRRNISPLNLLDQSFFGWFLFSNERIENEYKNEKYKI